MLNRNIDLLHPHLKRVYEHAKAAYHAALPAGYRVQLNETFRSLAVQQAYYAQGRRPLAAVNALRQTAGLYLLSDAENRRRVTNSLPGSSRHGTLPAEAFDVVMIDRATGKAEYKNTTPYKVFAEFVQVAARVLGVSVSSGAYWKKFPDFPHHQLP